MKKSRIIKTAVLYVLAIFTSLSAKAQTYYWEAPSLFSEKNTENFFPETLYSETENGYQEIFWQEADSFSGDIYINIASRQISSEKTEWKKYKHFAGPVKFKGRIPKVFSTAHKSDGTSALAVLSEAMAIDIYTSTDGFETFTKKTIQSQHAPHIAPRIFTTRSGSFILFTSYPKDEMFSTVYSVSKDGLEWSSFKNFTAPEQIKNTMNPIVPFLVHTDTSDIIFYQTQETFQNLLSIQLYASRSTDGCNTWSVPVPVTANENLNEESDFHNFNNQALNAVYAEGKICIIWERSQFNKSGTNLYYAELNEDLSFAQKPFRIDSSQNASHPKLFLFNDALHLTWFSNKEKNNKIYLAFKKGLLWSDAILLSGDGSNYPSPLVSKARNEISVIWEDEASKGISILETDTTVQLPEIKGINFEAGKLTNQKNPSVKILATNDSSDIKGFSWSWSQDPDEEPPLQIMGVGKDSVSKINADKDGTWYVKARQCDYAGNWSECISLKFELDITPPEAPLITEPETDDLGFISSNTFALDWTPDSEDTDIAGYTWTLKFISRIPQGTVLHKGYMSLDEDAAQEAVTEMLIENSAAMDEIPSLPQYIVSKEPRAEFINHRNGLYLFVVAAVDSIGNIGKSSVSEIILNKYMPETIITGINTNTKPNGDIEIDIYGAGFTYDGAVSEIYIDKDGKAPYTKVLYLKYDEFTVTSDNRITNIVLKDIPSGTYQIGVLHPDRGVKFAEDILLSVEEHGTIKTKVPAEKLPQWKLINRKRTIALNVTSINSVLIIILAILILYASIKGIISTLKESASVHSEVKALIRGVPMPHENKEQLNTLKQKGIKLRTRLMLYSTSVIILMDIGIILTLGIITIDMQEKAFAQSLKDRVTIMLDSITRSSQNYLPYGDIVSLSDTANQVSSLPEAEYAIICGQQPGTDSVNADYIWATTDKNITSQSSTVSFIPGTSRLTNPVLKDTFLSFDVLNFQAKTRLGFITQNLAELEKESNELNGKKDPDSLYRLKEIQDIHRQLLSRSSEILNSIANQNSGSIPDFDTTDINLAPQSYTFYKPILYQQASTGTYVHGIVFLKINTETLTKQINDMRHQIFKFSLIIIFISIVMCILLSYIISSLIVHPIRRLVKYVTLIRDTDNKEDLEGKDIHLRNNDEIGLLGDTLNEMTHALVNAAKDSKTLVLGKDVQTKFIPLKTDENENVLSSGKFKAEGAEFFTYYAGADDLSGDYVDYKKVGPHHYAIIKCDISGHGAPAALIMVEVATLFLSSFNNWDIKNPRQGTNLAPVVGLINDLLESRGFKGRFAAFTLCILDTQTGECHFCNAGDNLIQIYDGALHRKRTVTLTETPAAGMFPTSDIDRKGGYPVSKLTLRQGDILFLYTDGIEESKRFFRNSQAEVIECNEMGLSKGEQHGNHLIGEKSEQFTDQRVSEIIEAVMAKSTYKLNRYHDSENATFTFDFSNCTGSAEETILALVSIEKVFRFYRSASPKLTDRVRVDKSIDEFLRMHFVQYSAWCSSRKEIKEDTTHVYYNGILEDKQYDDLTLFAIRKE